MSTQISIDMIFDILNKIPPKLHAIHTHFWGIPSKNTAKVLAVSVRKSLCIFMKPPRGQNLDLQDIKSGKCENSAQKWPDYVKITYQNSTDYVKSLCQNNKICDLQIANSNSNIIGNYEKVTSILIFHSFQSNLYPPRYNQQQNTKIYTSRVQLTTT